MRIVPTALILCAATAAVCAEARLGEQADDVAAAAAKSVAGGSVAQAPAPGAAASPSASASAPGAEADAPLNAHDAMMYSSYLQMHAQMLAQAQAQTQAQAQEYAQLAAVQHQQTLHQQYQDYVAAQSQQPQQQHSESAAADAAPSAEDSSFLEMQAKAHAQAQAQAQAQWGFGRGFQPQLYGYWQQKQGSWNFGNDKRIECEACTYVTYMLISRLGDQFNRAVIKEEAEITCSRVQWVFKSACDFVLDKNINTVSDLVMKLIEPHDICKHLDLCMLDHMDMMGMGGMNGFSPTRMGITLPPAVRASMFDARNKGSGSGSGSDAASGASSGFGRPGMFGMQTLPFGQVPLGLQPLSPADLYGVMPKAMFGGGGSGSGSGSAAAAE